MGNAGKTKKVFNINCSPSGSTGKIITDTAAGIKKSGWDSCFCFPSGSAQSDVFVKTYATSLPYEQSILRRISEITGDSYGFAPLSTARIISAIKKEKPDVVHLHCINSHMVNVIKLINWLKNNNIPTVFTNHCEMFYTGNCAHAYDCGKWKSGCGNCPHLADYLSGFKRDKTARCWRDMKNAFSGFEKAVVTSVSPWVYERSCASPIMEGIRQEIVENGIDTGLFSPRPDNELRNKMGIPADSKIIFHVTSIFDLSGKFRIHGKNKGSRYVVDMAERFRDKNISFVIAGQYTDIGDLPSNMYFLGRISAEELAKWYSNADLGLVTSGRETFGLTVAEALCCGTPVVGFKSGGAESIAIPEYSRFCDFGKADELFELIDGWIDKKSGELDSARISEKAAKKYSKELMTEKYLRIYESFFE